jgi:hypothetical protein
LHPVFTSVDFPTIFFFHRGSTSALHPIPNLEDHVPVSMTPSDRVFQLYAQEPGSLFIFFYDWYGYGGGILTRLHTGLTHSRVLGRLNSCWPSPAQSFLTSVSSRSITKTFILFYTWKCFEMGPPLRRRRGRSFCVGAPLVAPQFQHEYIRAVTASRSLLCHCTVLSNIYTRYTEVSFQCLCSRLCLNLLRFTRQWLSSGMCYCLAW